MQRISVTVGLNRSTLQFDDAAYRRLEQYLADAASLLEGDPDPQEILGDLEQAVADQCMRRLQPGQTVVTLAELQPGIDEIGEVQVPGATGTSTAGASATAGASGSGAAAAAGASGTDSTAATGASGAGARLQDTSRGLQQVSEGAVISGVCKGLASYLRLNVTLLRIFAVLLLLASGGGVILVYLALMLLLPYAPLERGAGPIRWLPARSREFVEFLRAKLHVAPG
jgi:phage shock protein PspC (stress-responsive transcriptional regulator)